MDKSMICPRCLKNLHHGVHTCTPTPLVRELETEIERLRAELAVARSELAECRRGAERYRTALEQIVAPFEDLNFVSGNKLLTYIHDVATAALAAKGE